MIKVNSNEHPFPPNKYVQWFAEALDDVNGLLEAEASVTREMFDDGIDELDELFELQFDKMREEYHEFVHECPMYVMELRESDECAKSFMEEGYDLLQALCQVLMMGECITGVSHDTMVASTLLKCLSRDDSFYRG